MSNRSPAPHLRPFWPAYIAIVCCTGQNEQVSEERDSEYEALDERLQAIYSLYFLPLVNAYINEIEQ